MKLLKSGVLNPFLRFVYRSWDFLDASLRRAFFQKIRFAGTANLKIEDVDFKMFSNCDDAIVDSIYFHNQQYGEWNELRLFKEFSKNSKIILDIGANTGLYSIISKKSNPKAKVFAFEPYKANFNRLKKNLELNKLDVRVVEKAVGESVTEVEFAVPEKEQLCDVLSADIEFTNKFYREWIDYKKVKVPQITIDQFISDELLKSVDLIKIDVENYELSVLKGAEKSLSKNSPVILIEIFPNSEKEAFFESFLQPMGYYCYILLGDGILRTDSLLQASNNRNFLLSKYKSQSGYLPYSNIEALVKELQGL